MLGNPFEAKHSQSKHPYALVENLFQEHVVHWALPHTKHPSSKGQWNLAKQLQTSLCVQ